MAKVNLSKAAKLVGKNRTTIWRHIKIGKLSSEKNRDGLPMVDTSELIRVYGEMREIATSKKTNIHHQTTSDYSVLLEVIKELKRDQAVMMVQIENLTNRLNHTPAPPVVASQKEADPEDDPLWPKKINSVADIALRNEIKEKYHPTKKAP